MTWTLTVKDLGPFKEASIEVKPLTIFIGRNSSGKSFLLRLMWALSAAEPDYELLVKNLQGRLMEKGLSEDQFDRLTPGKVEEYIKLYAEALTISLLEGAKGKVREVFNDVKGTIRLSSEYVTATVDLTNGKTEMVLRLEDFFEVEVLGLYGIKLRFKTPNSSGINMVFSARTRQELNGFLYVAFSPFLAPYFMPFFRSLTTEWVDFLADSRAGLLRYKLTSLLKIRDLSDAVMKGFIDSYFSLLDEFHRGGIEVPKEFFEELGFNFKVVDEGGFKVPYVQLWNGKVFPLSEAPSGIREALPMALALNSKMGSVVYIEEPEAHLHPRAQRVVAKMIADAVKRGKYVIITTHSDYLLYSLSNIIGIYRKDKEAGLDPSKVSAYLLKRGEKHTEVEKLTIDEYGINEEEFGKVAEEMLDERGKIFD